MKVNLIKNGYDDVAVIDMMVRSIEIKYRDAINPL